MPPRVIVPKGSAGETPVMKHDPRLHIHRRRSAIGRLRSLTTGAAIAGFAGTAGFGVLAAATWSGNAAAADQTGGSTTIDAANGATGTGGTDGTTGTNGTTGTTGTNRRRIAPSTGGSAQQPTTATPRVQRATGGGHASTGGSH